MDALNHHENAFGVEILIQVKSCSGEPQVAVHCDVSIDVSNPCLGYEVVIRSMERSYIPLERAARQERDTVK
jgi:hypothetical protein